MTKIRYRVYEYLKRSMSLSFFIFFAIALAIWYLNRLGGDFQGVTEVPITIVGRKDSIFFDQNREYVARCNVRSQGYNMLYRYIVGYPAPIEIPASELLITAHESIANYYHVDVKSLEIILASRLSGESLISIADSNIGVSGVIYSEKRVPVVAPTAIDLKGRYMQVGKTVIEPREVTIYGDRAIVDTVEHISTNTIVIDNPYESLNGYIDLVGSGDYSVSEKGVTYSVDVEQYTEVNFNTAVEVFVQSDSVATSSYITIPSSVKVKCNIARSLYRDFDRESVVVYVNVGDKRVKSRDGGSAGADSYRVEVYNTGVGVDVVDISPKYITVLKKGL